MNALLAVVQEPYVRQGFGEQSYHNTTTLYPVGLLVLLICALGMFLAPRRYAIIPLIALESIVPTAQRIVIAGLDWIVAQISSGAVKVRWHWRRLPRKQRGLIKQYL